MLERRDRALPLCMFLLVGERRLEHRAVPALRALGHLRDGHLRVALRETFRSLVLRLHLWFGRRFFRLRGGPLAADAGDLDPGQRSAEARVPLVAGLRLVLADPHLGAALVTD